MSESLESDAHRSRDSSGVMEAVQTRPRNYHRLRSTGPSETISRALFRPFRAREDLML